MEVQMMLKPSKNESYERYPLRQVLRDVSMSSLSMSMEFALTNVHCAVETHKNNSVGM